MSPLGERATKLRPNKGIPVCWMLCAPHGSGLAISAGIISQRANRGRMPRASWHTSEEIETTTRLERLILTNLIWSLLIISTYCAYTRRLDSPTHCLCHTDQSREVALTSSGRKTRKPRIWVCRNRDQPWNYRYCRISLQPSARDRGLRIGHAAIIGGKGISRQNSRKVWAAPKALVEASVR